MPDDRKDPPEYHRRAGDTFFSDDIRDMGWVRQNVPCQAACPAGTNIPAYIRAIHEGDYGRAYDINREANVLPGVLGRICSRPCEAACRHGWSGNGEPVAICALKRSAADLKSINHRITESHFAPSGKKVAIVGAGPSGVAAAYDLSLCGHDVTLLERETHPGGMLRYGIPEFRLPRDILDIELHNALRLGVRLRCGVTVTREATGETTGDLAAKTVSVSALMQKHDAVLLSTGCMQATPLPLRQGQSQSQSQDEAFLRSTAGVYYGLDFLMTYHRGGTQPVGKRVAVVGAGFTALDCARLARRLGAEDVSIHLRTTEEYIPVTPEELFEAKREGLRLQGLRTPVAIGTEPLASEGGDPAASPAERRLTGVTFVQNRLGGWRSGGRRQAIPIPDSEFFEPCDTLIIAIGQQTLTDYLDVSVELDRWQAVRVGADGQSSLPGLFAAGDFVTGPTTVIEAIAQGRRIARHMDAYLMGQERRRQRVRFEGIQAPMRERAFDFIPRVEMPTAPVRERIEDVNCEVETGYAPEAAAEEAKRCYLCHLRYQIDPDRCIYCRACIDVAPRDCIKLVEGVTYHEDGSYDHLIETTDWSRVGAIWIDNNSCIRCGACYLVCPVHCISISRCELVTQDR